MSAIIGYDRYGNCLYRGDYVIFDPGYKVEIGRVSSYRDAKTVFVYYHSGDTAEATAQSLIRKIENQYVIQSTSLGGGIFDI